MRNLLLASLVLPSCPPGEEIPPCEAAATTIAECDLEIEDSMYPDLADTCPSDCVAECVAGAFCDELDPALALSRYSWGSCGGSSPTEECISDCNGGCDTDDWTPLVLVFDGAPVRFAVDGAVFDSGRGPLVTDWPSAPWLALDRNGNGLVDDASELFGDATPLATGGTGPNGFAPLAELDADGDGWITPADPSWPLLRVWTDADGKCSPAELEPLPDGAALELAWTLDARCDARGNCERERARLVYVDATGARREGAVVDVHVRARNTVTAAR
ncbi:MAG: calcium-binding protein [Myxococcota bacterium]